jgi:O-ureido-D-serine cyclo-ligase
LVQCEAAEFVVKPAIGAGSRDAQRYSRTELPRAAQHIERLGAAGRSAVLQPYLASVDHQGETALIYFRGQYSHAVRKGPLLRPGRDATRALFAPEHITSRVPCADELSCARRALEVLPFPELLYARVDLIRDAQGAPRILEVELTEPSLFFNYAPDSAGDLADAALAHLAKMAGAEL